MGITTEFDTQKINDELLNKLRVNLNSYDTLSRVEEKTITTTTTTATQYDVNSEMSYVKSVTLNAVLLTENVDYTIIWRGYTTFKIELTSAPTAGQSLVIVYGKKTGNGNFVYPDLPRNDLSLTSYPRVGFKVTWRRTTVGSDGDSKLAINNEGLLQIKVVAETTALVTSIMTAIDNYLIDNFKGFYYIRYIEPQSINEYDNFDDNTQKTFAKIIEYLIPDKYQIR